MECSGVAPKRVLRNLAKVGVEGSNPFARSILSQKLMILDRGALCVTLGLRTKHLQ